MKRRLCPPLDAGSAFAVILVVGCHSKAVVDAGSAPIPTPSVSVVRDAALDSTSAWDPLGDERKNLARWNEAHVKHDVKTLRELYGTTVRFYGTPLSGEECVKRKAAAFAAAPDYTQSIRHVRFHRRVGGEIDATFIKHTTANGKSADFASTVTFGSDPALMGFFIKGESDAVTDAKMGVSTTPWCLDADGNANNAAIAPFTLSTKQAVARVEASKHYKANTSTSSWGSVEPAVQAPDACPSACLPDRHCGYMLTMIIPTLSSEATGMTMYAEQVIYVNAKDGAMAFKDDNDVWTSFD